MVQSNYLRQWNKTVQIYSENAYIPVAKNCFAVMFTNVGNTIADVEGMVIFPSLTPATSLGDSRTLSAHELEVYTGSLNLSFRAPVGTLPAVEIVQLYYI